ncbi:hypothetical protein ACS0TY_008774 [Phlomoides rotata]
MLQENTLLSSYDEALEALSSLITKLMHADKSNSGDQFDLMFDYVKTILPSRDIGTTLVAESVVDSSVTTKILTNARLFLMHPSLEDCRVVCLIAPFCWMS